MRDSYAVLGISREADAETIRQRYLELVRQYPPEKSPQEFNEIRSAYDCVRDPVVHLQSRLFDTTTDHSLENLLSELQADVRSRRIPTELLLSLARS